MVFSRATSSETNTLPHWRADLLCHISKKGQDCNAPTIFNDKYVVVRLKLAIGYMASIIVVNS